MKNLIKKNQLMITALAIMIAIAAYLQFSGTQAKEEADGSRKQEAYAQEVSAGGQTAAKGQEYIADGVLDLSQEDLTWTDLNEIAGLDSETEKLYVEDYLEDGMQTADGEKTATPEAGEIPGEAVYTSGSGEALLSDAKLIKEQIRAKNKETLMEIINSEGLTDIQKQTAVDCMVQMTTISEKEAAAEILLEAKGYSDIVVSINGDEADVVVNATVLDDTSRAQIEDIVKRKTGISPEKIIISTVVQ